MSSSKPIMLDDSNSNTTIAIISQRGSGRRRAIVQLPYQLTDSEVERFAVLFEELIALGPDGVEEAIALYWQRAIFHPFSSLGINR